MFSILKSHCKMGKYSNNLERHGKDDEVPAWTIPITGVMIDGQQLCVLMHDLRAVDAFFLRNNETGVLEPRVWTTYANPILITDDYDGMATEMLLGDEKLSFNTSRLKQIKLGRFFSGGMTQIDCNLLIEPGLDRANLLLQEFQNEPIELSVENAKVAAKKKLKQKDLFDEPTVSAAELTEAPSADATVAEDREPVAQDDPLYPQVVKWVIESRITTQAGVQCQFSIGYNRAALIMGAMEIAGIVGPVREDNSREIHDASLVVVEGVPPESLFTPEMVQEVAGLNAESFEQPSEVPAQEPEPEDDDDGSDDDDDEGGGDGGDESETPSDVPASEPDNAPVEAKVDVSPLGRKITAHAKKQARKAKAGSARKAREMRTH